jgi:excisionase family DNA binding protein
MTAFDGLRVPDSAFFSREKTAQLLGIGLRTLNEWLRKGRVPSQKIEGRRLIPRAWLEELAREAMQARSATPGSR